VSISLPQNDWVKLRQVLQNMEQQIAAGGGGTGTGTGVDGRPGAAGVDGTDIWAIYHTSDLTAMPTLPETTPVNPWTEGKAGWRTNAQSGSNWMATKRSPDINQGAWSAPFPIRGMSGITVIADCQGRWKLDEGTGSEAEDTSDNSNHATLTGGSWITGIKGGGVDLNGTTNTLVMTDDDGLDFATGDFSIACWVKTA